MGAQGRSRWGTATLGIIGVRKTPSLMDGTVAAGQGLTSLLGLFPFLLLKGFPPVALLVPAILSISRSSRLGEGNGFRVAAPCRFNITSQAGQVGNPAAHPQKQTDSTGKACGGPGWICLLWLAEERNSLSLPPGRRCTGVPDAPAVKLVSTKQHANSPWKSEGYRGSRHVPFPPARSF